MLQNPPANMPRIAGASIVAGPETMFWGDRTYVADDPARHRWTFARVVKEVSPEDMKPGG